MFWSVGSCLSGTRLTTATCWGLGHQPQQTTVTCQARDSDQGEGGGSYWGLILIQSCLYQSYPRPTVVCSCGGMLYWRSIKDFFGESRWLQTALCRSGHLAHIRKLMWRPYKRGRDQGPHNPSGIKIFNLIFWRWVSVCLGPVYEADKFIEWSDVLRWKMDSSPTVLVNLNDYGDRKREENGKYENILLRVWTTPL